MASVRERTRVTVDLDPAERKRLAANAAEHERSMSAEIRLAIRDYLEKLGRRTR